MAEYDILSGLSRILASEERREQTRLQSSLAMMEMAQRRKMQSFEMVTKQLEIGTAANQTLQLKVAGRFLDDSGLNALIDIDYSTPKDKMETPDLNKAVKDLKRGKWGEFSDSDAQRIVSAVWLFRASQDPTNVIEIMSDLRAGMETGEGELYKSFKRGARHSSKNIRAFEGMDDLVWQAQESIKIGDNITKETREIAEGDFRIKSDLGLAERLPPSLPEKDTSSAGLLKQGGYQETVIDEIKDNQEQIRLKNQSIRQSELVEQDIRDKISKGLATDEEKEKLLRMPEIRDEWNQDIQKLQSNISGAKSSADALAELEIRELVRKVGKKGQPRAGEKMLEAFAKGGTFDLLEQLPEELVALIVSGDREGTKKHHAMGNQRFTNEEGETQRITTKEYNKLVQLSETVRRARALEAGKRGTGYAKSIDLPYEPPSPIVPTSGPLSGPIPSQDDVPTTDESGSSKPSRTVLTGDIGYDDNLGMFSSRMGYWIPNDRGGGRWGTEGAAKDHIDRRGVVSVPDPISTALNTLMTPADISAITGGVPSRRVSPLSVFDE